MHDHIISEAIQYSINQNKSILILGSPRSGTHALGSVIHKQLADYEYFGEIGTINGTASPWNEIEKLYTSTSSIAHLVAMTSKLRLSLDVDRIHKHCVVIQLRRENKIAQFASYMYFHLTGGVNGPAWHNHKITDTKIEPGSIVASDEQIDQFLLEQIIDDFFRPDYVVHYEQLNFDKSTVNKNQFSYDLPLMFKNLDHVTARLGHWKYSYRKYCEQK